MSKHDDGGPAFPSVDYGSIGMSLRDWFAGQALAGVIAACCQDTLNFETREQLFARNAYAIADAMLAERARREEINR